ncbi:MAG: mercury(II) reductase, partial [Anaerolineae bacterium]|nr:mercury(II) reductase [Anaerolineae bacterium]
MADAYPYSPTPTSHLVRLGTGVRVYCMCAIDCFYVPFLTGSDITIESRCHLCGTGIHVRVERGKILMVVPVTTVVWDSEASYDCPKTNFFCSEGHLVEWRTSAPDEPGRIRSL